MEFYSHNYLIHRASAFDWTQVVLFVLVALLMIFSLIHYLRDRKSSKYRELALIALFSFVLLGLFLFTNPVANLVAYSWWIAFGLLVASIAAILGYFSVPKELRSPAYLFQGIVNLLLALYLVAYGFVTLPVVIPTILGIWLIVEAIIAFFKGNRLGLIFPIIGNHIMWIALLAFLLGLVILFNPVATSVFVVYVVAFAFLIAGFTYILDAFRK